MIFYRFQIMVQCILQHCCTAFTVTTVIELTWQLICYLNTETFDKLSLFNLTFELLGNNNFASVVHFLGNLVLAQRQ